MSTTTTNYELVKPALTDVADITAMNSNWDTIDTQLKSGETNLTSHTSNKTNPHDVTKAQVGLGNVDNTSDANKPVSTATQTALDGKVPTTRKVNGKALSADITLSNTDVGAAASSHTHSTTDITSGTLPLARGGTGATTAAGALSNLGLSATATELNYTKGVTSAIQTQLNGKQSTITGAGSTIASNNLTANRALVSNGSGKVAVSSTTSTEVNYLSGVTSKVQTQLNNKIGTSGGELTGDLVFQNKGAFRAIGKYRTINNKDYYVNFGCGQVANEGCVTFEIQAPEGTGGELVVIGRLEVRRQGVAFVDADNKRHYLYSSGLVAATVG